METSPNSKDRLLNSFDYIIVLIIDIEILYTELNVSFTFVCFCSTKLCNFHTAKLSCFFLVSRRSMHICFSIE